MHGPGRRPLPRRSVTAHADIVTDTIETFTESGIRLASGQELEADVVVTATGLNLQMFGGAEVVVDGEPVHLPDTMAYKGMMLSGVPNLVYMIGYTNASWTLKVDLVAEYVVRLLRHLRDHGLGVAVPERDPDVEEAPFLDFGAGYVQRSIDELPKQGDARAVASRDELRDRRGGAAPRPGRRRRHALRPGPGRSAARGRARGGMIAA